ncbi:MAG: ABC transporter permease [Lachnospiraceae bacterium]|nr:ABC transporter permease [Lachnospiraceae bacterium]
MKNIGKDFIRNLSARQKKGLLAIIIAFTLFTVLTIAVKVTENSLYDQKAAKRWSLDGGYAQISCFFPTSYLTDDYYFLNLYHTIEAALTEASMQPQQEGAKLFVDAYSTTGSITVSSQTASVTIQAVGVSPNFFRFHPLSLIDGAYFDENMIMQDGILLDEDAAWQLFGSNDIVGMQVMIGNIPYYVRGVVDRSSGHFEETAGLDKSVCYVSADTLQRLGQIEGSYTYEIVLPNPVDGFAMQMVTTALKDDENKIDVIENSKRFRTMPLLLDIKDFGIRSMSRKGIIYPYWENIARAYEDIFAVCLFFRMIALVTALVLIGIYLVGRWKRRTFTIKDLACTTGNKIQIIWKKSKTKKAQEREE